MARTSSTNSRTMYFLALLALLFVAGVAPSNRLTGAFASLSGPVKAAVAPVSGVASFISVRIRPGEGPADSAGTVPDERYAEMEREWLAALHENRVLKQYIAALEERSPVPGDGPEPRKIIARRIGADIGAGTIDLQAGTRDGVRVGDVASAVSNPRQLVGAVTRVHGVTCTLKLITDEHFTYQGLDQVQALVLPRGGITSEAELAACPRCQLSARRDGLLDSSHVGADAADALAIGDEVVLDDDAWPAGAQMLTIGRIVRIEETENPLHKRIVVRPTLDLSRVGSVVLRLAPGGDELGDDGP